jgi:hypothetical protein
VAEYALRFDADELGDVALLRESQDYRSPFLVLPPAVRFDAPITLEGEVVFSCLKGGEDGRSLIMRVFNASDRATTARVRGPVTVERTRMDESGGSAAPNGVFEVAAGQIATLRLRAEP